MKRVYKLFRPRNAAQAVRVIVLVLAWWAVLAAVIAVTLRAVLGMDV